MRHSDLTEAGEVSHLNVQTPRGIALGLDALNGSGTEPPSTRSHTKGEIVWNSNPTVGSVLGWICTVSGKPGTWNSFGSVNAP